MRISIATKLLLSFFFILALSFLPAYWYLRRDLLTRVMDSVEADLGRHAQLVAGRLGPLPDAQLDAAAREVASVLVDRVSVIAIDGRVLGESAVPSGAVGQIENHLDREEVQRALQGGQGRAVRSSTTKGEPYLYVARVLKAPDGRTRGVVRLSRPLGAVTRTFQGAVTFLYRAAGVAASLVLVMSLGATIYTVRPLLRIRQAVLAYARGEYNFPLPARTSDEIGDLGESMGELARLIQKERAAHSADGALRGELVRALPAPVLLLDPDGGVIEINAPFREAADIDPAHEHARVHEIVKSPEFGAAAEVARRELQAQPLSLPLPWRKAPLRLQLCPMPAPAGRLGWALIGDGEGEAAAMVLAPPRKVLRRAEQLLAEVQAPSPAEAARLHELRVHLGLLHPAGVPAPEAVGPLPVAPLLTVLLDELRPLCAAQGVQLDVPEALPQASVADSEGRVERVLRAALWRSLGATRPTRLGERVSEPALELSAHRDKTALLLQLSGLHQAVGCADLDQLLSPLGGGLGPSREAAGGGQGAGPATGIELWIQLRLA